MVRDTNHFIFSFPRQETYILIQLFKLSKNNNNRHLLPFPIIGETGISKNCACAKSLQL